MLDFKRGSLADAIVESMPFADELIAWCNKHPAFKEGLKITNPANFIALGAVLTSTTENAPGDEVIGFLAYDIKEKYFKQDFIINVGGNYTKFVLYSKVPSKKYGPYVQHINNFFAKYGKNGAYEGTHHMTLEKLDSKVIDRARRAIALAERIEGHGRRVLTQEEILEIINKIREAKRNN
ncbi:MAG: hypothetical protein WAP74_01590 [Patescibacteria group bacterium]